MLLAWRVALIVMEFFEFVALSGNRSFIYLVTCHRYSFFTGSMVSQTRRSNHNINSEGYENFVAKIFVLLSISTDVLILYRAQ